MLRRLLGFLSVLLLLNVSAAEALRLCASQAKHQAASPAPVNDPHAHHHGAPDCGTPKSTQCCGALSSCGTALDLGGAAEGDSVIPECGQPLRGAARAPVMRVFSPDPPPPKIPAWLPTRRAPPRGAHGRFPHNGYGLLC